MCRMSGLLANGLRIAIGADTAQAPRITTQRQALPGGGRWASVRQEQRTAVWIQRGVAAGARRKPPQARALWLEALALPQVPGGVRPAVSRFHRTG